MVDRDEKLRGLINDEEEVVAFLNGERPPAFLRVPEDKAKDAVVRNSCYHIQHTAGLDEVARAKHFLGSL